MGAIEANPTGQGRNRVSDSVPAVRPSPLLSAGIAGVLVTLSIPPFGWWPLGVLGVALLGLAIGRPGDPQSGLPAPALFGRGLVFGIALYAPSLRWMSQFTVPGAVFAVLLESGITALGVCVLARRPALLPVAIVTAELFRSRWPFGGIPIGGIDLGQAAGPFAAIATWGGRLAVVALVACAGMAMVSRGRTRVALVAITLFAMIGPRLGGPIGTHAVGGPVRFAVVQGGGPIGHRARPELALRAYQEQVKATEELRQHVDVIAWPEDVVDRVRLRESEATVDATLAGLARSHKATLIVGEVEAEGSRQFRNTVVAYGPAGESIDRYEKVKRVPYGEYFPFRGILQGLGVKLPKRDAIAGRGPAILRTPAAPLAVAISYEGFFSERIRNGVRAGGEIIVIPTNASSYRSTQVPTQQIAAAQLRALESGRWVVQVAPTGYSALIDPNGRLRWRGPLGNRVVKLVDVPRRIGLTPYERFGDWPVVVLTLAGSLGGIGRPRLRSRRAQPLAYRDAP